LVLAKKREPTPEGLDAFRVNRQAEAEHSVLCSEPSPDAAQAIAQSLKGSLSGGGSNALTGSTAASIGTSIGYIGMRTVMVQSLRDLSFNACLAYANGALSSMDYERIMRGAPPIILGVEAIDALAGPQPPPPLVLSAQAPAATPDAAPQKPANNLDQSTPSPGSKQAPAGAPGVKAQNRAFTVPANFTSNSWQLLAANTPLDKSSQPTAGGASAPPTADSQGKSTTTQAAPPSVGGRTYPPPEVAQAIVNVLCLTLYAPDDPNAVKRSNDPWSKVCTSLPMNGSKTNVAPTSPPAGKKPAKESASAQPGTSPSNNASADQHGAGLQATPTAAAANRDVARAKLVLRQQGIYTASIDGRFGAKTTEAR
jgi:hypothetical protein